MRDRRLAPASFATKQLVAEKDAEYYMGLHYPVQLVRQDEDGEVFWLAEIPDLPGCMTDGTTPEEALKNIEDAKRLWVETLIEDGFDIPEPAQLREYSGKLLLRMPKSLHERLAINASQEGVSLNQYVVSRLSGVGLVSKTARPDNEALKRLEDEVKDLRSLLEEVAAQTRAAPEPSLPIAGPAKVGKRR